MPWGGTAGTQTFTRGNGDFSGAATWAQTEAADYGIRSDHHDTHDQDLATGISACLLKNGNNSFSANLRAAGFKLTGLGPGTGAGDSVNYEQLQALVSPLTTVGDILYRDNAGLQRLPAGTDGYTLKQTGAGATLAPAWSRPSGIDYLEGGALSAGTSHVVNIGAYSGYQSYEWVIHNILPVADATFLGLTVSIGGGAYMSNYSYILHKNVAGVQTDVRSTGQPEMKISDSVGNTGGTGWSGRIRIHMFSGGYQKILTEGVNFASDDTLVDAKASGFGTTIGNVTHLKLTFASAVSSSGLYSLLGIR